MPDIEIVEKARSVQFALETNLRVADLRCSLFFAALLTYRHPTCLKPFPSFYTLNGNKQYDQLLEDAKKIPPLHVLIKKLSDRTFILANKEIIDLLHYILVDIARPHLESVPYDLIDSILKKVPSETVSKPHYIFEVVNSSRSQNDTRWANLLQEGKTLFAYHGSKLENFHSILHHGLQQLMNKNMLYGSGTYLSSELSVSILYSPAGLSWENSCLGRYLSCVALCELADTPDGVVSRKPEEGETSSKTNKIPSKYYLVKNDDLVRIRYLLIYAKDMPSNYNASQVQRGFLRKWLSKYKFLTVMIVYLAGLVAIGVSNNNLFNYYCKIVYKKLSIIFK